MRRPKDRRSRFGPNADDVVDFLDELDRLSATEVMGLAAAGAATTGGRGPGEEPTGVLPTGDREPGEPAASASDPRLAAARVRLRELAEVHRRMGALRAVGDEIADWAASLAHWFPAGVAGGSEARSDISPRMAALPVILDAAYATVMEDLLTADETDLLCGAWNELIPDDDDADEADDAAAEIETKADGPTR